MDKILEISNSFSHIQALEGLLRPLTGPHSECRETSLLLGIVTVGSPPLQLSLRKGVFLYPTKQSPVPENRTNEIVSGHLRDPCNDKGCDLSLGREKPGGDFWCLGFAQKETTLIVSKEK